MALNELFFTSFAVACLALIFSAITLVARVVFNHVFDHGNKYDESKGHRHRKRATFLVDRRDKFQKYKK